MIKRIRNNLKEWDRLPSGYRPLRSAEKVEGADVQRLHDTWYAEYPSSGMLVGHWPNGQWFRKERRVKSDSTGD